MKIIKLEAENIKRLKAISITPNGSVVEITGRNAQGKTSVLDSIAYALGGERLIPTKPIRNGETSAMVRVTLGDGETIELVVERRWTDAGSYLAVKSGDGAKYPKGQQKLNDIIGLLSFDPLAFTRQEPKKQAETLRSLTGLDFTAMDKRRADLYEQRRDLNRDAKALRSQAEGIAVMPGTPDVPISMADESDRLAKAMEFNQKRAAVLREAEEAAKRAVYLESQIDQLKAKLKELSAEHAKVNTAARELHTQHRETEDVDIAAIRATIADAERVNTAVAARKKRDEAESRATALAAQAEAMSAKIDGIDEEKVKMLSEAKLPINGLGLADDVVTFNGIPFDQCSAAEQLRVSVAMGLAMNPALRVMLVRDGSLLDEDSMRLLAELAEQNEAQVWVECVAHGEPRGIVIEDGEVAG